MKPSCYPKIISLSFSILVAMLAFSCKNEKANRSNLTEVKKKIGVLLVNHGSRSETWRNALLDLEIRVKDSILTSNVVEETKTAFMEYTEPSIATRLKEFDAEGYTDVIIVPIFLTVSSHSFDDIPTIIGAKEDPQSLETLKIDNIERYTPKAKTQITPLLDFSTVLKENVLRRTRALSKTPAKEGLVLIAYGDATYTKEWTALLNDVGEFVKSVTGITGHAYGWCGHVAHYNPDSTTVAINRVLKAKEVALVVPVLVAHDEMFQVKIIGDGIAKINKAKERISYKADSILPDANVEKWVMDVVAQYAAKIQNNNVALTP
jgi:hypothetical protein